jgi:hypothetical protein
MAGLLRPDCVCFVLLFVLILFGPRKLPGRDMRHMHSGLRSDLRAALFMAKGVDPGVGRDVGDMLPDEEARQTKAWARILVAILLGILAYLIIHNP